MKKIVILTISIIIFTGCTKLRKTEPVRKYSPSPVTITHRYSSESDSWERTVILPASGKFAEESHYVTTQDSFQDKDFPSASNENIQEHLQGSFKIYRNFDPDAEFGKLYKHSWQKVWTPEEDGKFGQGSTGSKQLDELTPEDELWVKSTS